MSTDRIAVEANVLVYAFYRDTPQQAASRALLERAQRGELTLCFTSQVLAEFFSIVTSVKRVSKPRAPEEAVAAIEATLAIPGATMLPVAYDSHHDGWIC
jgi:predicted nucleic acid-binding protein